jgi:hypothetical protein
VKRLLDRRESARRRLRKLRDELVDDRRKRGVVEALRKVARIHGNSPKTP